MLHETDATAMLAVKDVATARAFYEGTLGFEPDVRDEDGMVTLTEAGAPRSWSTSLPTRERIRRTRSRGRLTTTSTRSSRNSRTKGVTFEHYDLPNLTLDGDVHVADGFKGVWFKDPDGNILHINGR